MSKQNAYSDAEMHMIDILISSLEEVTNPPIEIKNLKKDICSFGREFKLASIGLESLSILELCINLEFNHSIILSPEIYLSFDDINDFLCAIKTSR